MMRSAFVVSFLAVTGLMTPSAGAQQQPAQGATQGSQTATQDIQGARVEGPRVVIGRVTDTRQVKIEGATEPHQMLKLENDAGQTLIVDLGSTAKHPKAAAAFDKGDRIVVIGRNARIGGEPVLFARYAGPIYQFGRTAAP